MKRKAKHTSTLRCDVCGKSGSRLIYVTRSYGRGNDLLLIENVPVISCPHCWTRYLTSETLHELERIKSNRRLAPKRSIPVAKYA